MADPSACAPGAVNVSTIYVGAAYRACDPTADGTPQAAAAQTTMADVVAALPELSTFAAALNQSRVQELGLPGRLAAPGSNLTLFAPSNEAFADALAALNLTGVPALLSSPQLVPLLLLHVARGAYTPEALARTPLGAVLPTLSPSLFSNISAVRILRLVRQPGGGVAPIKVRRAAGGALALLTDSHTLFPSSSSSPALSDRPAGRGRLRQLFLLGREHWRRGLSLL